MKKKNRKNCLSNQSLLQALAETGVLVTVDCLKKSNELMKISPLEHYVSYNYISPFLELLNLENSGFKYKLERNESNFLFQRVAILLPYSVGALSHCFNVFGIDAAFLDGLEIKKLNTNIYAK